MSDINWNDRLEVIKAVKFNGENIHNAPEYFKKDKGVVRFAFRYADEELKCDKEFIKELIAIDHQYNIVRFMANELKKDINFIKELILLNQFVIEYIDEELFKNNKELVLFVMKLNANNFDVLVRRLGNNFVNNKELIIDIIKINFEAIKYIAKSYFYNDFWDEFRLKFERIHRENYFRINGLN